jgi:ATP-dependent helicase Lhr and Lhr-like helicase
MYTQLDKLIQEHKTTIVFTNTRAATERIVDHLKNRFPKKYVGNIGAHHGSLGKNIRHDIEDKLRKGQLKVCVTSTSLELGIDIGFVDLVVCLGSPKSVARFLQRAGRAGHQLTSTIKARIIVLDRDDLVECSVLLKSALDRKIDKLHIPTNCLDVLAQQITGMAIDEVWNEQELYNFIKQSYCYKNLTWKDFTEILDYLAGNFVDLQERYIFGRIWRKEGKIGRRGKMGRVIYLTNIGTIPDQSHAVVKVGDHVIGTIDESFLEKLRPGDVFVLGGETYEFKFSRGMTAQVKASVNRPPTVPAWFSEMLPLSYDLALEIGKFRRLMFEKFLQVENPAKFVQEYLPVDEKAAQAITDYFKEQYMYTKQIPNDKLIIIETIKGENTKIIFHTLYGRRVNDCLSRAIAFVIGKQLHTDVEVGINDNGFFIALTKYYNPITALKILTPERLETIMSHAIEKSDTAQPAH